MEQLARFDRMRSILLDQNRFYMTRLKANKEFTAIPFTTKAELVDDQLKNPPFGTNLTFRLEDYVRIHQTSGTTGKPILWLDTQESWDWWLRCWGEVYKGAGVQKGDRVFLAFSFGPFIGFWAAFEAAVKYGALAISGGSLSTEQRVNAMLERGATVLCCTPTYALRLAEVARGQGVDLSTSAIRVTVHAGEPGASIPSTRSRIQEAFGALAFDHSGMTEVGAYGFECETQTGLHINESEFIAEVIDPETLEPVDSGVEGELVLTNLGRLGMPLVRYRTGDRVLLSREPCPCGRPWARLLGGVLGRTDDMFIVRGVNVFPAAVENIIRRHSEVTEFMIEVARRREMQELSLKIEVDSSANGPEVAERIRKDVSRDLHVRASIECMPQGSLPRFELKARRVRLVD